MPALRIEQLATQLFGPISFEIAVGECVTLMGPSGVGKSLLLRAIVDLDPSTGNVIVGGRARGDMPASEWRKLVALVPAESGWWADRVGEHFPSKCDATELVGKLDLQAPSSGMSVASPPASASGLPSLARFAAGRRLFYLMSQRHHSTIMRRVLWRTSSESPAGTAWPFCW